MSRRSSSRGNRDRRRDRDESRDRRRGGSGSASPRGRGRRGDSGRPKLRRGRRDSASPRRRRKSPRGRSGSPSRRRSKSPRRRRSRSPRRRRSRSPRRRRSKSPRRRSRSPRGRGSRSPKRKRRSRSPRRRGRGSRSPKRNRSRSPRRRGGRRGNSRSRSPKRGGRRSRSPKKKFDGNKDKKKDSDKKKGEEKKESYIRFREGDRIEFKSRSGWVPAEVEEIFNDPKEGVDYSIWLPVQRKMVDHVLNEEMRFKKRDTREMDLLKYRLAEDDIKRNKDELKKLQKKLKNLQKGNDLRQYVCYPDSIMAEKVLGELPQKNQKSGNQFQRPPAKSNDRVHFKPKPKPKPQQAQGKPRKPPKSRGERPRSIERCCDAIAAMAKGQQTPRDSSLTREDSLPPPNYSWPTFFAAFAQGIFARSGSIGNSDDDMKERPVLPKRGEHDFFGVEPPRKKSNPSRKNSNPKPAKKKVQNVNEISVVENQVKAVKAEPGGNFNETILIGDTTDQLEVGSANSVVSSNIRIQLEDSDDQSKVLKEHCVSYKGPVSLTLIIGPVNGAKTVKQLL